MGNFGEILPDFYQERTRILEALAQDENKHIPLRLIGALAFRSHCPQYGYIQDELGRVFTDIDFVSYRTYFKDILAFLSALGYEEDKMVTRLFGEFRLLFHDPLTGRHIDIFFDRLDFCHAIPFKGRLEADPLTLPLAELLLEKMQIVEINAKDLIDTVMLLLEHPLGEGDAETINLPVVARLCAADWGLWRTVSGNLDLVEGFLDEHTRLPETDHQIVQERLAQLRAGIAAYPKTARWKLRSKIGERVRWYKEVEELAHR